MSLWRLEWLRLTRTRRWMALVGVYLFFGFLGPITARYFEDIVGSFGGDVTVIVPDPVPADGIAQYVGNIQQLGVLVVVVIAAGALAMDALAEMSIFLRTRVERTADLLAPRLVVTYVAAAAAFLIGTATAWYETAVLLGPLPVGAMAAGTLYALVYLAFVIGLVALVASRASNVLSTVLVSVVVLLVIPLVGMIGSLGDWLPSRLSGSLAGLVAGDRIADHLGAAVVTALSCALMVALAARSFVNREL